MSGSLEDDYSPLCIEDLKAFYGKHNPAMLGDIDRIVRDAKANGIPSTKMFDMLYNRYNVSPFSNRDRIIERTRTLFPGVSLDEILSEMRRFELNGLESLNTEEYFQAMQKKADEKKRLERESRQPQRMRALSHAKPKANIDEIMAEEAREWLVSTLGDDATDDLRHAQGASMCDALRDGVLLQILLQKLKNPKISSAEIKRPKGNGFHGRDNVTRFIRSIQEEPFNLRTEVNFTDVDLCDGKNYRQVVTSLLQLAKIAFTQGVCPAPPIVQYDKEIEEQSKNINEAELDQAIENDDDEVEGHAAGEADFEDERLQQEDEEETARLVIAEQEARVRLIIINVHRRTVASWKALSPSPHKRQPEPQQQQQQGLHVPECNQSHTRDAHVKLPPRESSPPVLVSVTTTKDEDPELPPAASAVPLSPLSPKRYVARRGDEVDKRVGSAVNNVMKKYQAPTTKIKRLKQQGQYVIYHKITGKRTVCFVRVVQKTLMIRVGGGWEDFEDYLQRRMVEWENVPKNRLNHQR